MQHTCLFPSRKRMQRVLDLQFCLRLSVSSRVSDCGIYSLVQFSICHYCHTCSLVVCSWLYCEHMSVCVCCVLARVESMMGMSFLLSYNMLLLPNAANACDADIIVTCLSFQRTGKNVRTFTPYCNLLYCD